MKQIDLHIHTVATFSDAAFEFSLDTFKNYVSFLKLDGVAVTNHDVFDAHQFNQIQGALGITVFPGIEINVDKSHVLLFAEPAEVDDFAAKCAKVTQKIQKVGDNISVTELKQIYGDLNRYLIIPHTDKHPGISGNTLDELSSYISAGEVDSPKKFVRAQRDVSKVTPVLFSDARMKTGLSRFPARTTFVDCGELSIASLRMCLRDKTKVTLSPSDGNRLWRAFDKGPQLSTGLNVLLGARSSGKTHMLEQIFEMNENVKYLRQFSLVQHNPTDDDRSFKDDIEKRRSTLADDHLADMKRVVDTVMTIDLKANDRAVDTYLDTLRRSAKDIDKQDSFSRTALFNEVEFQVPETQGLFSLINSVIHVIENIEYRPLIEKHVELPALRKLAIDLISVLRVKKLLAAKMDFVNSLVREIQGGLRVRTSATAVDDVNLYAVSMDAKRVLRFDSLVNRLKSKSTFFSQAVQGFRVEASRGAFSSTGEVKTLSGTKLSFSGAFARYDNPYEYLRALMAIDGLARSDIYRLLIKISYRILNRDGFEVSGGERSEYRLLQQIQDAQNFEVLLIDEPESSFDNLFLKSDVNQLIKDIAQTMPVVVVTHNSTVGASIQPNYRSGPTC